MLLAQLRDKALAHVPDNQWKMIEQAVEQAGSIRDTRGYAGTVLFKAMQDIYKAKNKIATVMGEFKSGKLESSSGAKVTSPKQAIAIALSEERRAKKKKMKKASFGGDRSAAGRYAAEQRWKGHTKRGGSDRKRRDQSKEDMRRIGDEARARAAGYQRFDMGGGAVIERILSPELVEDLNSRGTPSAGMKLKEDLKRANLSDIAQRIRRDLAATGKKVPFGAEPYLAALSQMNSIDDYYGEDAGSSIVAYLLANLSSYKGETARAVKAELNARFKDAMKRPTPPRPRTENRSNPTTAAGALMRTGAYVASGQYRQDRKRIGARAFGTLRRKKKGK